jgi:hypothetical protein
MPRILATILNETIVAGIVVLFRRRTARLVPAAHLHMRNKRRRVSCAINAVARSKIGHANLQIGVRQRARAERLPARQAFQVDQDPSGANSLVQRQPLCLFQSIPARASRGQDRGVCVQYRSFSLIAAGLSKRRKRSRCLITDRFMALLALH